MGDSEAQGLAERKPVTVLFCDLVGSTALADTLDPEAMGAVQASYFDRMRSVVQAFGGTVEKFIGDAVVAVFGVPRVHEDDPLRAVRCALAMQAALVDLNNSLKPRFGVDLHVRIGVNTGDAFVSGKAEALATRDVVNTAARLQQAAASGQVVVGRDTMLSTRGSVIYGDRLFMEAKGKASPLEAWPALSLGPDRPRPRSPLVGRERELDALAAAVEQAVVENEPRVLIVLGEPGIGKSRLTEEFAARVRGRAAVHRGACVPYGEGASWLPLAQIVRSEAGVVETDTPDGVLEKIHVQISGRHQREEASLIEAQLLPLVGGARSGASSSGELLWAFRRYLEGLAETGPTVIVLDDLHWASPILVETVQDLADTIGPVPLVMICTGRPELRQHIGEMFGSDRTFTVALNPLSEGEALELATNLALARAGPRVTDLAAVIAQRGEGNPLFVEELAAMAAEEGVSAGIPSSVRSLIAARLDLLPPEAKRAVQAGAVVGEAFWEGAVAAISHAQADAPGLSSTLRVLRIRGLVEEDPTSSFMGARQFRFHHALIRDVAYDSIPKRARADMHREAASWLSERTSNQGDLQVTVAHHLDRALSLAGEVAPLQPPEPDLVRHTVDSHLAAAEWARSNAALPEAIRVLRRGAEISAEAGFPDQACRAQLAWLLADHGDVEEAADTAKSVLATDEGPEVGAFALLALAEVAKTRGDRSEMVSFGERAAELARLAALPVVEAHAVNVLTWVDFWEYRLLACEQKCLRVARMAEDSGDQSLAVEAIQRAGVSAMWRGQVALAEERALDGLRMASGSGSLRALALAHGAVSHVRRVQDRLQEAVEHGRERLRLHLDVGERFLAVGATLFLSEALLYSGQLDDAWNVLEQGRLIAGEIGGSAFDPAIAIAEARILLARPEADAAETALGGAGSADEGGMDDEDMLAARAEVAAAQGRWDEAEEFWAVTMRRLPDLGEARLLRADILLRYADFLAQTHRGTDAATVLQELERLLDGSGGYLYERRLGELRTGLAGPA